MIRILTVSGLLLALGACGLRGDLQRPDPLWGEPEPPVQVEEPELQEDLELRPRTTYPTTSRRDPVTGQIIWVQNENGGDKPLAKPTKPVEDDGGLPPVIE